MYKEYVDNRAGKSVPAGQTRVDFDSFVATGESKTYGSVNPRQKMLSSSLVSNLIVGCRLPISVVDNSYFRKFMSDLDPKFAVPCRQTVTYSVLPHMLEAKQQKLRQQLQSCRHLALTTDIWSDRRSHAFLGVTVHMFVEVKPHSQLRAFQAFHGTHSGQRIAEAMASVVSDSGIQNRIRWVVTYNASNMKKAMSVWFDISEENPVDDDREYIDDTDDIDGVVTSIATRIPCFAHSLQLVVHEGLSALNVMRPALAKCSKAG